MTMHPSLRLKNWLYVFGWVACIYSTLSVVRPLCAFLKATTPFSLLVNVFVGALLVLFALVLWRGKRIKKSSTYFFLAAVLLFYACGLAAVQHPEEKIHFIEYGFLAYLAYKAVRLDVQGLPAYGYAFLLTSAFGWIDEGIQFLLPNRYYQLEDVVLNAFSGALGLVLVFVYRRDIRHA